jgi:hypothetical protein
MAHGCLTIIGRFGASIEESGVGLDIVCLWRDENDLAVHIRTGRMFRSRPKLFCIMHALLGDTPQRFYGGLHG